MNNLEEMVVNVLLVLPEGLTATTLCEVIKNQNIPEHSAQSLIRSMLDRGYIVLGEKLNLVVSPEIKRSTNIISLCWL